MHAYGRRADGAGQAGNALPVDLEREILIDLSPEVFRTKTPQQTQQLQPAASSFAGMTPEERTQFAVELAHSVPFPAVLKKLAFGAYRLWFRIAGSRAEKIDLDKPIRISSDQSRTAFSPH